MLLFATFVFLLIITPGPGVLSLAGVGAAFGRRAGLGYMTGLYIGNAAVALIVVTGLAAILLGAPWMRTVLSAISTGYLLYLAARIALAQTKLAFLEMGKAPSLVNGITLQLVNPKAYAVNTVLFANFEIWPEALGLELTVKFIILSVIWTAIHGLWLWAGIVVQGMNLAPKIQQRVNIAMALSMLAAVALAAFSAAT